MFEERNKTTDPVELQSELFLRLFEGQRADFKTGKNADLVFLAYSFLLDFLVCHLPEEKSAKLWRRLLDVVSYVWLVDVKGESVEEEPEGPEFEIRDWQEVGSEETPELFTLSLRLFSNEGTFEGQLHIDPQNAPDVLDLAAAALDALFLALYGQTTERGSVIMTSLVLTQCNFYLEKEKLDPADLGIAPNIAAQYVHSLALESLVNEE